MARVEETLDPLTASSELFSDDTNEDVTAFKGALPKSFYANSDILSRRLNVLFTKSGIPLFLPMTSSSGPTPSTRMTPSLKDLLVLRLTPQKRRCLLDTRCRPQLRLLLPDPRRRLPRR